MGEENIENGTLTFRAAILRKWNRPLVVGDVSIYIPGLGCGQVLVRVHASGICGAQLGEIIGASGHDPYLPHLLGHEGGGEVVEIGAGVKTVKKGDRVVMHWRKGVGMEANCPMYKWQDGEVGGGPITTFNEYAVVSENRLTGIDDDIPFEIAALMGCAVTTGLGIVNNEACVKMGQSVAVIGCGGVGLNVIQGAAMVSAHPIWAFDIHNDKLRMAKEFGATDTVNLKEKPFDIKPGDGGCDVVVECTGIPKMIEAAYIITGSGGRTVLAGQPHHTEDVKFKSMRQHFCGKTLLDSQGGLTDPTADIPNYLKLYHAKKLKLDELITHHFALDDVNDAIETVRYGHAGRVMLEMK